MINNNKNIINMDPFKQIISDDKVIDFILEKVMRDSIYIENFSLYDSGKIEKNEFIKIINDLVLKYKREVNKTI